MRIQIPNNAALIVVDVQNGFINRHTSFIPTKILELLESVNFKHRIFTQFLNFSASPYLKLLNWNRFFNESETDIVDSLKGQETILIEKNFYTGVTTEFLRYAKTNKIDTFYLVGIDTDICVLKTAVDLFERSLRPVVLSEYCMSHAGKQAHEAALSILPRFIGEKQIVSNSGKYFRENYVPVSIAA